MNPESLSTEQLAKRWKRSPRWITYSARIGAIPGAWKSGHLWRFYLPEIEAYELSQQAPSVFALSAGAAARRK